jgi:hypothetical protein
MLLLASPWRLRGRSGSLAHRMLYPRRSIFQISGEDHLGSVDHEEGCKTHCSAWGRYQAPEDRGEFCEPSTTKLVF